MSEFTLSSSGSPSELSEALQTPTQPVSPGFVALLTCGNVVLFICYIGIASLLLPLQIGTFDPANKAAIFGLFTGTAALLAVIGNPLAGALSDRTTSRFGRRRPWIFSGAILSAIALAILMTAHTIVFLYIGWALFQLFSNFTLATLTALIPDKVPTSQRGMVSGIVGLGIPFGAIIGSFLIGQVFKVPGTSYAVLIVLVLVVLIACALFLGDKAIPKDSVSPFHLGTFLKNFWVNPRTYPDFAWAWVTRFLPTLGYFMGTGYILYYLQDAVKYQQLFPGQTALQGASTFNIVAEIVLIFSTVIGGILSDLFQRRKLFVIIASVVLALALLLLGLFPVWEMILVAAGVLGLGFGAFLAVDLALVTQVLPSPKTRARDLGIYHIGSTLPQTLAPAITALVITNFHSYTFLFIAAALFTLLGVIAVGQIKGVR